MMELAVQNVSEIWPTNICSTNKAGSPCQLQVQVRTLDVLSFIHFRLQRFLVTEGHRKVNSCILAAVKESSRRSPASKVRNGHAAHHVKWQFLFSFPCTQSSTFTPRSTSQPPKAQRRIFECVEPMFLCKV